MTSSGRHQLTTPSNKVNKISCSYYAITLWFVLVILCFNHFFEISWRKLGSLMFSSNVICLVNPQNGSWVQFTILQNSLQQNMNNKFCLPCQMAWSADVCLSWLLFALLKEEGKQRPARQTSADHAIQQGKQNIQFVLCYYFLSLTYQGFSEFLLSFFWERHKTLSTL